MRGENKRNKMQSRRAPFSGDESAVGSGAATAAVVFWSDEFPVRHLILFPDSLR
ncbi:hypothetical protein HanIR_Chr07g0322131 [Helianthus annuus]|nr:hypothetical protein HanIR_Chr07g0322131 [Helianthus annuus]